MADFPSIPNLIEPPWLTERLRAAGLIGDAAAHTLVGMGQQAVKAVRQFASKAAP